MISQKQPLTNIQVELLKLYSHQVEEVDLIEIKQLIGQYFSNRLSKIAEKAWVSNSWTDGEMDAILNDPNQ